MIRFVLFLLFVFMHSEMIAQNRFVLTGTVPYDGVEIELGSFGTANSEFITLKTKTKNKKFHFSGTMDEEFEHVYLRISKKDRGLKGWTFYIKPGEMKVDVLSLDDKTTKDDIRYFNVPFISEQNTYDSLIKPLQQNLSYSHSLLQLWKNDTKNEHNLDSLAEVINYLKREELYRKVEFVKDYPNSFMALYTFNREILNFPFIDSHLSPDNLIDLYSAFNKSLQATGLGRKVLAGIAKKQKIILNKVLPDFSFLTSTGEAYRLSSFFQNKKFVLLCFWDAGCAPCIRNFPLLRRLNETYAAKGLQMISVSIDATLERWTNSLKRYDLPWLQTCDLPPYITDQKVRSLYDINYIPQYFLLDKDGKLIYHNTQSKDGDDYSILQEMLSGLMP